MPLVVSVHRASHVTITHEALGVTRQGPVLYRVRSSVQLPLYNATIPTSDIWCYHLVATVACMAGKCTMCILLEYCLVSEVILQSRKVEVILPRKVQTSPGKHESYFLYFRVSLAGRERGRTRVTTPTTCRLFTKFSLVRKYCVRANSYRAKTNAKAKDITKTQ